MNVLRRSPLDASAMTLTRAPPAIWIVTLRSPLVDMTGRVSTTPVRRTSRPSVASPGPDDRRSIAAGSDPLPSVANPFAAGRTSSWP